MLHRSGRGVIAPLLWVLSSLLLSPSAGAATAAEVEAFTRFSEFEIMRLSPDGRRVAVTRRAEEYEALLVMDVDTAEIVSSTQFGSRVRIDDVFWASDERLLVQPQQRFPGQTDGYVPTGEIIGIDPDGRGVEVLFGFRATERRPSRVGSEGAMLAAGFVIDMLPGEDDYVLVESMGFEFEGIFNAVYRLHVRNGNKTRIAGSPIRNGRFVTNDEHEPALVSGQDANAELVVYHLTGETGREAPVWIPERDGGYLEPIAAWGERDAQGNERFLVRERVNGDTMGLAVWTPATGSVETFARHPMVDVDDYRSDADGVISAVRYLDHYPLWQYPEPEHPLAQFHAGLAASNPQDDVVIYGVSEDGSRALAYLHGPLRPGTFLVLDTEQPAVLRRLDARPWHEQGELSEMSPVEIRARDGLLLRGYLTERPRPAGDDAPRSLVVRVHGGPHGAMDAWTFDPVSQLLARAGHAVLQLNFRGSGGRGAAFEEAGYGRWGAEMQDDVTDAVNWAIQSGIADPERICIVGTSYGAYAALAGAFRTPELYRCAIGNAGVYDLELMFDDGDVRTSMAGQSYLEEILGTDPASLRSRSPVHNVGRMQAAVMLAHGDLDQRAPIEHALRMKRALERAGKDPVWFRKRREGHGFSNQENFAEYWSVALSFLDEHLGAEGASAPR